MRSSVVKDHMEDQALSLKNQIADQEHRIYVLEHPMESRRVLAGLLAQMRALELNGLERTPDSPTWRDGSAARSEFVTQSHRRPWPEPPSVQSVADLRSLHATIATEQNDPSYVASATMPGLEVVLTYLDGVLCRAVLRGDGLTGEDVTDNIRAMPSVPLRLRAAGTITETRITKLTRQALGPATLTPVPPFPHELHIRAFVTMRTLDLTALDRRRVDAGDPPYVLPRAAVLGSLRRLDPKITATRRLKLFATSTDEAPAGIDTEWQRLGALKSWGFSIMPVTWRCKGLQEVLDFVGALQQIAPTFEYPLEGGSLVVNRMAVVHQDTTAQRQVRLIFPAPGRPAIVKQTYFAVGRGGGILPVVQLEKDPDANLAVPDRAPLPAQAGVHGLGLAPGRKIRVRPGTVAPVIVIDSEPETPAPDGQCPACSSPLHVAADEPFRRCVNADCIGRARARLLHMVGPRGLKMQSLSVKLVERLVAGVGIRDGLDLLLLNPSTIEALNPGAGSVFEQEVEKAKRLPLWRLLYLLAIPHVSERSARVIAHHLVDLEHLMALGPQDALRIEDIPVEAARGLSHWLQSEGPRTFVRIKQLQLQVVDSREDFPAPFLGQNVVVAGELKRGLAQAGDEVERRGGLLLANVGRLTDVLIWGTGAQREFDTAAMYRVPAVDEDTFEYLVDSTNGKS